MKIGIIGSTGVKVELLADEYELKSVEVNGKKYNYYTGKRGGHDFFLVARNNFDGAVPPHLVDYPGIMKAFKFIGVDFVVATSVVGSLNFDYKPGEYVILDQFLDMTKNSPHTVYDEKAFAFVDFTNPYCPKVREALRNSCENLGIPYHETGCYVGVDGPRYETAAEVKMYRMMGGDVVGMTNVSEAIMARELGICYGSVAIISNFGAGMEREAILRQDCYDKTMEVLDNTIAVIKGVLDTVDDYSECYCRSKNSDMIYTNL